MAESTDPTPATVATNPSASVPAKKTTKALAGRNLLFAVVAGLGVVVGVFIPQNGIRPVVARWLANAPEVEEDDAADEGEGGGVFDITMAAQETYGLKFSKVSEMADSYVQHIAVPAFVRERPTTSNLQACSRMSGIVRKMFVQVGQSVREGDPLMELELTGDALASAQAVLLDSVQQLQIIDDEINRLRPVAQEGIARKSLIEKQYERRRMVSIIESKRQELLIRGLTESEVDGIIRESRLVRTVVIKVPSGIRPEKPPNLTMNIDDENGQYRLVSNSVSDDSAQWVYSVESMMVSPGSVLQDGEPVCDLAYHETLLIEGQAYERDLTTVSELINNQTPVSVEVGDSTQPVVINDLKILYMDNHVDNETQTYRFYIEILNTVLAENLSSDDRRFRTWRFKPGQRGHVRMPQERWENHLVLPADAVAEEGVDHVIFRRTGIHDHFDGDMPPHSEFKKLVVSVAYSDQYTVVVDHRNQLSQKQTIAINNADMLLRASSSDSGGGHHHHHDH